MKTKLPHTSEFFINRETGWLEFNRRVLFEALDPRNPLLERTKFIAIFSSNLDEFFMKRVGGLKRQLGAGVRGKSMDGLSPYQQLEKVREMTVEMVTQQRSCLMNELLPALRENNIVLQNYSELTPKQKKSLNDHFKKSIFPILTPLGTGPGQPFPFISNLSLSLAVRIKNPKNKSTAFARIKIPHNRPRWVPVDGNPRLLVPLEQIIAANLGTLFPGMDIVECAAFRVTRNADIERNEEEADDLLDLIEEELRFRKYASVVRLEVDRKASTLILDWLSEELDLSEEDVYPVEGYLNLVDLWQIVKLDEPTLKDPVWKPVTPSYMKCLENTENPCSIFDLINTNEILVHHPYESFTTTVQRFLSDAADDPKVLAIKQTLYRTENDSPMVQSLVRAAENNKQVAVLVEIKARFDEANNIQWVRKLESAGVHVTYGFPGLKTHTKVLLVIREEEEGVKRYFHIGTGNYHAGTANIYTDLGILSCRTDLGEDLTDLFNFLTGHSLQKEYHKLLVAPVNMRKTFEKLIQREINHQKKHQNGRIVAKMNSLEDPQMIEWMYKASRAGVKIDLIVRGMCCLRPGVQGLSENIRVMSIIGRFLEHSRIFHFNNNGKDEIYIGSADWMGRNLDHRVEAITPVENANLKNEIKEIVQIMLNDNRKAWDMNSDGTYVQRRPASGEGDRSTHELLMQRAMERA